MGATVRFFTAASGSEKNLKRYDINWLFNQRTLTQVYFNFR